MEKVFASVRLSSPLPVAVARTSQSPFPLKECKTGVDRIAAPLLDKEGVVIAHKTGSGYVNENGVLAAHNDVAYICLPNNISYTLAVFVKDFKGNESQASQYVAHISAVVYSLLMQTSVKS